MRNVVLAVISLLATGCGLYSEVSIGPNLARPTDLRGRATTATAMVEVGDFGRAAALRESIEARQNVSAKELAALGRAELASGRLDDARRHLREALNRQPFHKEIGAIAWDLSQVELLANNYGASLEWALYAGQNGMTVKRWHLDYLESLSSVQVNTFRWPVPSRVPMLVTDPTIPRVQVRLNGAQPAMGVIDTGAVVSIVSESLAQRIGLRSLGTFRGTFYGLLGEPIDVRFGLIDSLVIGDTHVTNIPVAVMPDRELQFFIVNRQPFNMEFLLGVNLLKEFRIELDYRDRMIEFTPLSTLDRAPAENQNLFFLGFRPMVQAAINRRGWFLFVLDTGSEITFLNDNEIHKTNVRGLPKLHGAMLQGLGGAQKRGAKVENVEIGVDRWAGTFKTLPLYGSEQTQAVGILGQNMMKHFRVVIDFGRMRVDLHRR